MSNYPPGVTGNEPQITGEWPCASCGGSGGERGPDGPEVCWMCRGSGIHPEETPACPECDSSKTEWFGDMEIEHQAIVQRDHSISSIDEMNVVVCMECGEVSR